MWIFDDPANVGWNATSGPDMLGNGFGWGQQSHLLAWINFVTGLVPTEVFCRTQHSEVTGADLSHSATIRCGDDCVISISGTTAHQRSASARRSTSTAPKAQPMSPSASMRSRRSTQCIDRMCPAIPGPILP